MRMEIFRTGEHVSHDGTVRTWTKNDLNQIVANFSAEVSAPLVIGHPKINDPALGWVKKLEIHDNGDDGASLFATTEQENPKFVEAVKNGAFRNRSISLTKDLKLRHIGFLGGFAPAIEGLKAIEFATDESFDTYEFSENLFTQKNEGNKMPDEENQAKQPVIPDDKSAEAPSEGSNLDFANSPQFKEFKIQLDKQQEEIALLRKEKTTRAAFEFAENAVRAGKIPPASKENVANLYLIACESDQSFEFAGPDSQTKSMSAVDILTSHIESMPAILDFGTHHFQKGGVETTTTKNPNELAANYISHQMKEKGLLK